ncbi:MULTISPECIES: nitronate monooxygenase [Streptomycetaceae]|uniref:Probable nitronate monooxygenase n=1 Tax=Streptantibioticus cattleyicolor (strain ATCC 35852 / DSM 46488 / JCM 4925 / NBRC 14057 / NRRL 8057) TaxID=1003195 RepID=F8JP23_STREN|nr:MULTISPECIES: nitronate monooxygenase [Streptomycetaceae]AEW93970.1 putative oxidoreductase [Streptantibioticus cattleyicolor NRRL 8057 = DSM 46488]MYS58645.1 nitronate monooxygenase [Streptomyces sp. SID5468]CCB74315.1 putative dioxygenase [Streptantibioticus cattleyicolor NRRL 8057 = DSM 46488]
MPTLTELLPLPVVQAPMAGGASGPALAAVVSGAGGLGFLAAGYKTPEAVRREIAEVRALTARPFGVNVFLPQPAADPAAVAAYAARLAPEADRYGTALGDPGAGDDDAYDAKVALLLADPVPVVSFTFGCPEPAVVEALRRAGTYTVVTVTSAAEAVAARRAGADAVCAQGTEAGAHQGRHHDDPGRDATATTLQALLPAVREAAGLPVIAAGGIMDGRGIAAVLAAGAEAAQLGTAFLATAESGAHPLHKRALTDPGYDRTELTRAFSGRPARGLVNRFLREHGPAAPAAYPAVHHLTSPLRKAAAAAGDTEAMALWAGQGHRLARELPAAELVRVLAAELAEARGARTPGRAR